MAVAMSRGLQDAGVVSVVKHFPGHGDTQDDSHHGIPVVDYDVAQLWNVELRPFQATIEAGAKMLMSSHVGLPALNDGQIIPSTLSRPVLHDLLRKQMGFDGVIVSDAMDMGAIQQGSQMAEDIVAGVNAGLDLLLMTDQENAQELAFNTMRQAVARHEISQERIAESTERILQLKQWVAQFPQPELSVIRSKEHCALAQEVANRAVTLVRNDAQLLPLTLKPDACLAVITPEFKELTPADTSVSETQKLAEAIRQYHPDVDEFVVPHLPDAATVAALRERMKKYDLVIVGTIEASRQQEQADLVNVLLKNDIQIITVAMRTPYDLVAYPEAETYICTYSIQEPVMHAVAAALFGEIPFLGKLPTQIPSMYKIGHGLEM